MSAHQGTHVAMYGNTVMLRTWCTACVCHALVVKGLKLCCDQPINDEPKKYKRMCEPEQKRKLPGYNDRKEILNQQENRCLYCNQEIETYVPYRGKRTRLRLHWDHLVPYAYSQNNLTSNFAAACHVCNRWKSALIFKTLEEAQIYLNGKWADCNQSD